MAELNPPLGTTTPEIFMDNVKRADELVNGPAGTVNDRGGEPLDTWRQMMAKNDEVRQNIIPLGKQYQTLAAAQADVANIPEGSTTFVRSIDDAFLAIEYRNVGGTLTATGRTMDAGGNIRQAPLSVNLVEFTDPLGFSHSRIRADGGFETPMSLLDEDEISSGNLSLVHDPHFDGGKLMLSDELGFSVPATEDSENGNVDPGEVTVDLPPQTAAYA
ncbi:hypothetical protein SBT29_27095, partial [Klebsiella pneumoniae]|nr:hypothetical protein [Klebsiella pneumoniae]